MNTALPSRTESAWRTLRLATAGLALAAIGLPGCGGQDAGPGTIVSLTFDDTLADTFAAQPILAQAGVHATFYVNSGRIDQGGFMTLDQLRTLASDGHEIAGHTVLHADLTSLDATEQQREICDDRAALLGLGFDVRSFAYPFAANDSSARQIAAGCGYDSARGVGGLHSPTCPTCPFAETKPPGDPFLVRTPSSIQIDTSLASVEATVTDAEQHGGGWIALVMHHVCDGCDQYSVTANDLRALVEWLVGQASKGVAIEKVGDVIGGGTRAAVEGPPPPPPGMTGNLVGNPSLESTDAQGVPDCWEDAPGAGSQAAWAESSDAHSGMLAQELTVTSSGSAPPALVSRRDLGQCAPSAVPGHAYTVSAWYHATGTPEFVAFYRTPTGFWNPLGMGPPLQAVDSYTQASWTLPALPPDATAVSAGLGLSSPGTLLMDDFTLTY